MPAMGLFRKPKKEENEKPAVPPSKDKEVSSKTYLKAMPLRDLSDLEEIKKEVKNRRRKTDQIRRYVGFQDRTQPVTESQIHC